MNSKFKNYTKDDMLKKSQQNTCFMAIDIGNKSCKSFDSFSSHDSFINFKNSLKIKEQNFYEIIREESVEYYDCESRSSGTSVCATGTTAGCVLASSHRAMKAK